MTILIGIEAENKRRNMNIEKLLEYQAVDAELIKVETDFRALPVCREYNTTANSFKDAQAAVMKLTNESEDLTAQIETLADQYKKLNSQLAEAERESENIADLKQADFYSRNVEKLLSEMQNLSKLMSTLSSKIEDHRKNYEKALKQGKESKQKGMEITPLFQKAREEVKPVMEELNKKLSELEKDIDEKAVTHYKNLRAAKKTPAIVPLHGEASCGGCFMEMAGNAIAKLRSDGYIECPNCSRIIYIGKKD